MPKKKKQKPLTEKELTILAGTVKAGEAKYFPKYDLTLHKPYKAKDDYNDKVKEKKYRFIHK